MVAYRLFRAGASRRERRLPASRRQDAAMAIAPPEICAKLRDERAQTGSEWEVRGVTYLIRAAIALLGGAGTVATYHQTRDPIFTAITAFVVIVAFVTAYLAYR